MQKIALPMVLAYDGSMAKPTAKKNYRGFRIPVFVEKGEDGFYIAECPLLKGCYTQGKTLSEALRNIREVALLVLEEKQNHDVLIAYHTKKAILHSVTL